MPQPVFSSETEGFVLPRELGFVEKVLDSNMSRDIVCPREDLRNVGGMSKVYRVDECHSFVAKLGFHDVIATGESRREFLDKNIGTFLLNPLHIVLGADAKDARDEFNQVVQVIFLLELLEIAKASSGPRLTSG